MAEDFEEKSPEFDPQAYLAIARRRHLHFLIPLLVGWLAVWVASWILPARYKSSTLILVEQPTMPKDYVTPNVPDNLQERLESITQQILSRTNLLHIIEEFDLYAREHVQPTPDEKVEHMRKDVEIDLVKDTHNQVTAFNVAYSSRNSRLAQQVTSEITNLFINENLEVRQQQSEDTTKFLADQLETARKSLDEQEEKIQEFKGQHIGELPTQLGSNLQILSGLQSQLQSEQDALNTAKQQHVYLETLFSQYRSLHDSPKGADGTPMGLPALDQELAKLRAELADLRGRYTERHPDVRKLKDQIAQTEKMREQLAADQKVRAFDSESDDTIIANPDDPQSASMAQLQSQMKANQIEVANREHSIETLKAKVGEYQARLNQEPVREQQLADLTRGYDQSKANYDDLLKKKNESAMATSMELLQQGERFRILDPPSLPLKADFPNRMKFCGIGVGVGLALGVIVAGAFEMMDDRIHDESVLQSLLPIAVISEVPEMTSAFDQQRRRRQMWVGWIAAALVLSTIVAGSAISFLRG
jgi:polysaccharide chain length determinant protein (PEP-CTERM system associated)